MSGLDVQVINKVEKRLKDLGVEIITNEKITQVQKNKVLTERKELLFDALIWCGGVKPSRLVSELPLKTEAKGRIEVGGEMLCLPQSENLELYGKVYGVGDIVCCYNPAIGKPLPMVARAALSQATVVAKNILGKRVKFHCPKSYPYIIAAGGKYAVAKIGPFMISGFLGWILKGLVELNYLVSIMAFSKAVKVWLKGLYIFIKNDRLG